MDNYKDLSNLTHTDVMDAIARILDIPVGDVYNQIVDGEFVDLAVQAFMTYSECLRQQRPEQILTEPASDDLMILQNCVRELENEVEQRKSNSEEYSFLIPEIEDLKRLIKNHDRNNRDNCP